MKTFYTTPESEKHKGTIGQNPGSNTSQNKELAQRKIIEGSPFYVVRQTMDNDKEKYFMVMGDYRLTEPTETEQETLQKLITEHWNIIANIVAITTEKMIEQIELEKNRKQETLDLMGFGNIKTEKEQPYETESL